MSRATLPALARSSWLKDVRAAGVLGTVEALGYEVIRGRTVRPCPACGAEQRGRSIPDRRGPVGVTADGLGFRCHRCQAHGDAVAFAALAVLGVERPAREQWRDLREVCARAGLCEFEGAWHGAVSAPPRPRPAPSPVRPARKEVLRLWSCCEPVTRDVDVSAWLRSRGIDPIRVDDLDLARALPPEAALPGWARSRDGSWADSHHRLLVPLYDEHGAMASMHARAIVQTHPKSLSPSRCALVGLVMADSGGVRMLEGDGWRPLQVWIGEGVPDFLTLATDFNESDDESAALGIVSGSWTKLIAARVPDGCRVVIATHDDEPGVRYASRIGTELAGRTQLFRWRFVAPEARA